MGTWLFQSKTETLGLADTLTSSRLNYGQLINGVAKG